MENKKERHGGTVPFNPYIFTLLKMKLLTKEILKRFERVGSQEDSKDPLIICKFFNPCGAGTWYATEYNPETKIFFGYVSIFGKPFDEWGYFSLKEFEEFRGTSPFFLKTL